MSALLRNQTPQPPPNMSDAQEQSLSKLKASEWSSRRTTYFCDTCGSTVIGKLDGQLWIYTGALDQLEGVVQIQRQIFVKDTLDGGFSNWLKEDLPIKTHATLDNDLPAGWLEKNYQSTSKASDRLHAHCLCKGVEFWIARPLASSADPSNPRCDLHWENPERGDYDPKDPWWLKADRTKFHTIVCACDSCRLAASCDFVQWAYVPTTDISLSANGSVPFSHTFGTLKGYGSCKRVVRYFCGDCGANVFWTGDDRPGLLDVAVGLLHAPEGSLAQDWLEWQTDSVDFKEDGIGRAGTLINHVRGALQKWGRGDKAQN
ncbi:hypothetical protein D6C80_05190 [Aureobasidium pullulans]|nr:hypothetical protein D6C80_05190 [Aureobasidium pullulans]